MTNLVRWLFSTNHKVIGTTFYLNFFLKFPFYLPIILFTVSLFFIALRLFLLLLHLASPLFAAEAEALVFASSCSEATTTIGIMMMSNDDDLSRAVAPFLPRGGGAPVILPEESPLTMEEEGRLALVREYQNHIGALLQNLDATWFWSYNFAEESAQDLVASTLLHKEEDLNDPDKLWVVQEGLLRDKHNSRYYFRTLEWVKTENKVRNGELPLTFIIDDDGEG